MNVNNVKIIQNITVCKKERIMRKNRKKLIVIPTLIAVVSASILAHPLSIDAAKVKVTAVRLSETK